MVTIFSRPVLVLISVTYYRPDYRNILQEFTWQTPDKVPELYRIHKFLNYWKEHIEAPINKVEVSIPEIGGGWRAVDYYKGLI
jgi:uncharacterized protein Usg